VVQGHPLDDLGVVGNQNAAGGAAIYGLTKLLIECHVQFDIVEPDIDFERYRLLVLPDSLQVDVALATRLCAFLDNGGAVLACHNAIRLVETATSWYPQAAASYAGESLFQPSYLKLGAHPIWHELPDYEYALYDGAARWNVEQLDQRLGLIGEPLFQRSPAHYTSHAQSPFDHLTDYAALWQYERFAALAFPIGSSYYRHGYWIEREVFRRVLQPLLPSTLIQTNAPLSAEVTLTHQAASPDHPARWLVHVVNFSPNRRSPEHCEFLEEPIPLHAIRVALQCETAITQAYLAEHGEHLTLTQREGYWEVTIPVVRFGEIVVFETTERLSA
jgi:Beta-galactosidase trimerisation domain